jgi:hypothetical protein
VNLVQQRWCSLRELSHEGSCFGKEDLQELQSGAAAARGVRDLLGCAPQATSGLMGWVKVSRPVPCLENGREVSVKTLSC